MKNNIVTVLLYGKEIGKIRWQGGYVHGVGKIGSVISFNPSYHKYGFDVDPIGPFNLSTYLVRKGMSMSFRRNEDEGLPRFLSGALPDDWGNQVFFRWIQSNGIQRRDITPVDKLSFIGKRGMGGFEFIPQIYNPASDDAIMLEELYELAKEVELSREEVIFNIQDKPQINDLMSVGMSAGGKHPKAIIAINWETGDIRSGQILLPERFKQYILKFKDSDNWPTAEIEYIYYQMAIESGINMQDSRLLSISGVNHFLTERFDRKNGTKVHTATLYSLYGEVTSYDELFNICRNLKLPHSDIEQLFRRVVFNYLSGVTDDHDKNFSFTMSEEGEWRLSPAYDITFTVNYKNRFIGERHAMLLGDYDTLISCKQFLELAEIHDISNPNEIISQIVESVCTFTQKANNLLIDPLYTTLISGFIKAQCNKIANNITTHQVKQPANNEHQSKSLLNYTRTQTLHKRKH